MGLGARACIDSDESLESDRRMGASLVPGVEVESVRFARLTAAEEAAVMAATAATVNAVRTGAGEEECLRVGACPPPLYGPSRVLVSGILSKTIIRRNKNHKRCAQ